MSDDTPDADETSEEEEVVKDFRYYAELAEWHLDQAEFYKSQIYNPNTFKLHVTAAEVYSRLATTVTLIETQADEKSSNE
jgi:hypothetical protein